MTDEAPGRLYASHHLVTQRDDSVRRTSRPNVAFTQFYIAITQRGHWEIAAAAAGVEWRQLCFRPTITARGRSAWQSGSRKLGEADDGTLTVRAASRFRLRVIDRWAKESASTTS
jgi:hypothetical protein